MSDYYGAGGNWLSDCALRAGIVNKSVGFRAQGGDNSGEMIHAGQHGGDAGLPGRRHPSRRHLEEERGEAGRA